MTQTKLLENSTPHNYMCYGTGLAFLALNKIRNFIKGYTKPRTFPVTDYSQAIQYDFKVVKHWQKFLNEYTGGDFPFTDKVILELGPGADLGIGIICLMKGAKKYNALDVNNLAQKTPQQFYDELFDYIKLNAEDRQIDIDYLRSQIALTRQGQNDKINYLCNSNFDLSIFRGQQIDLVFSQAAFEHFDNVEQTISQLSNVVQKGTILVTEVDLGTHTRWIRDCDPLNIYRFGPALYNTFRFPGSPNRLRPFHYRQILEKYGWTNINIIPLTTLHENYMDNVNKSLSKIFRDPVNQMELLSVMICATKK